MIAHAGVQAALLAPSYVPSLSAAVTATARLEAGHAQLPPGAMRIGDPGAAGQRPYAMVDNIAVIQVAGMLVPKLGYIGLPWATGYDGLRLQFGNAFAASDVRGIVIDDDSGGGFVDGLFDLVDWIDEAKAATGKPVAAICSDHAYSAAYAIATTADSIAVPRTGGVGSIGAVAVHFDWSGALKEFGLNVTIIQSGAHKADGNPFAPLPDDVRADMQARIDGTGRLFAEQVARRRGIAVETVIGTEARIFTGVAGTAEAVRLGLADAVLSPDEAFARFVSYVSNRGLHA